MAEAEDGEHAMVLVENATVLVGHTSGKAMRADGGDGEHTIVPVKRASSTAVRADGEHPIAFSFSC
jgi:hypothetical protein